MYRAISAPTSGEKIAATVTDEEFNKLPAEQKQHYTYETEGPAGPAPADKPAAAEVLHGEYDRPGTPGIPVNEALNQSTPDYEKIKAPEGTQLPGGDFDSDLDNFLNLQGGNKAPDGTPTGTAGDIQTEQLRTNLEPGLDSYSPGKEEAVSGSEVAAESAPVELNTVPYPGYVPGGASIPPAEMGASEENHEQMMAERKAAYERENPKLTTSEPADEQDNTEGRV